MNKKPIAIIPARGGSKRIPRKNIKNFLGKPMIAYAIETALESKIFNQVMVSTDDEEIAEISKKYGAEVPFLRSKELADDFTGTTEVVEQCLEQLKTNYNLEYQYYCTIYATNPFLQIEYLKQGYEQITQNNNIYCSFSCAEVPSSIQRSFAITDKQRCQMFQPEHYYTRSQDLESSYFDAGQFYWHNKNVSTNDILFGKDSIPIIIPPYLVQDIDTPEDWQRAEIMCNAVQKYENNKDNKGAEFEEKIRKLFQSYKLDMQCTNKIYREKGIDKMEVDGIWLDKEKKVYLCCEVTCQKNALPKKIKKFFNNEENIKKHYSKFFEEKSYPIHFIFFNFSPKDKNLNNFKIDNEFFHLLNKTEIEKFQERKKELFYQKLNIK